MSPIPVYSFEVDKVDRKTSLLKNKSPNGAAGWPLFSIRTSSSKPHRTITRADNPHHVIATISFHSLSSKIDITLHGQPLQLKKNDMFSSGHSFHHPAAGELKWKEAGFLSTGLVLVDSSGRELCKYKKRAFDVFVQVDHAFMDMILVTGLAAAEYKRQSDKAIGEAAGEAGAAVAGV